MSAEFQHAFAISEEISRLARSQRVKVIVEIKILLIQTINTMQVHLYRVAVECRKIISRNYILMQNNLKILCINPFRNLRRMVFSLSISSRRNLMNL